MKRTWVVRPDTGMQLGDGRVVEFVSREAAVEGFMDALSLGDRAGGVVEVVFGRVATDVPGEMLTNGIAFRWKDRVDATTSPEQPWQAVRPEPMPEQMVGELDPDPSPEELEARLEAEGQARAAHAEPDGLDPATLDEEDMESIPAELR